MADRIKGITVVLGGDTTGLNKALQGTNKQIKDTQAQLRDVEKLLKLDPTNTKLLEQRQRLLAEAVNETNDKLKTLKTANEQVSKSYKNYDAWKKAYDPIQAEIAKTSESLKELRNRQQELKDAEEIDTEAYRVLQAEIDETAASLKGLKAKAKEVSDEFGNPISQQQYDGLQREIIETEQQLKKLEGQAEKSHSALSKIGGAADKVATTSGKIAGTMAPATAAIAGLGAVAFNAASDVEESQNKVNVAFGESAEEVKAFAEDALKSYGIAKGTALDMASTFGDMGTSMGLTQKDAAKMSTSLVGLAGDLSSFKNIGVDQAMTALNGIFTGETESLKSLGVVMTQTNLDAYAMTNGFGKTTKDMTEAEKVQLRYAYVLNATQNAQGDFANTSDGAANSMRIMKESAKEATAEFGEALLPVITPLIQKVTELIQWFGGLDQSQKNMILTVIALVAVISPVSGIVSLLATMIGTLTGAIAIFTGAATTGTAAAQALAGVMSFIATNPIVLLIAAIVALVALIGIKGDEIQAILQKVDDFLQGVFARDWTEVFGPVFGNILNTFFANFKNIWNAVKQIFNGVIDFIRGVFTGNWERAWRGAVDIFGGLFHGLTALVKAPLNGVIGLINGAIGAINGLVNGFNSIGFDMPKWLGGGSWHPSIPNIPNVPYLAKGGILSKGTAVVGEAGPELLTMSQGRTIVQPLTNNNTTNHNLGGININVYGAPGQDVHELANIVMDQIEGATARKAAVF